LGGKKEKGLDEQTDTTTPGWRQSIGRARDEKEKEKPSFSFFFFLIPLLLLLLITIPMGNNHVRI
jgi:hypothetical protein